jgi:hypothetical protein
MVSDKPSSVKNLTLTRERSRNEVNKFLENNRVDHKLGGTNGWLACFGGRHNGNLYGVCVISRPTSRHMDKLQDLQHYLKDPLIHLLG